MVVGAHRRTLKRLPVALIFLLATDLNVVSAGSLSPGSAENTQLQKQFCAGPDAGGTPALCARLKAAGTKGPVMPAGAPLSYASRRPADGAVARITMLDMTVSEITGDLATRHRVAQSVAGVVVTDISAGGVAERAGVIVGDVLIELDQEPIESPHELARQIETLNAANTDAALLLLYRNYEYHFQIIAID